MDLAPVDEARGGVVVNRDVSAWLAPLVAVVLLAVVMTQTFGALRTTGTFGSAGSAAARATDDPFQSLDRRLGTPRGARPAGGFRDPFAFGAAPVAARPVNTAPRKPAVPVAQPRPVLTAIVWDAEPRALVRWQGREWTIRSGSLFDEFQVVSITRDQVTLRRGDESIVLQRKPQGE